MRSVGTSLSGLSMVAVSVRAEGGPGLKIRFFFQIIPFLCLSSRQTYEYFLTLSICPSVRLN